MRMRLKTVDIRKDQYKKTIQWIKIMKLTKGRKSAILFGTTHQNG